MTFEAIRLRSWYTTPQGQIAALLVGEAMARWLREKQVSHTLCLGFGQPYMEGATEWSKVLVGASPAEMGVAPWPSRGDNRIALVRPDALPFPDEGFDRVIMAHLLEGCVSPQAVLRETWRVLKPGGSLLVVAPNRGGLWARRDSTPFGWGRPFSPRQLHDLIQEALFIPRQSCFALFFPPFFVHRWLGAAGTWEKAGMRWFAPLGGVILCEAEKVVCAITPLAYKPAVLSRRYPLRLPVVSNPTPQRQNRESQCDG